jgi:hypothetical protein
MKTPRRIAYPPARGDYAELLGYCITTRQAKEQGETTIAVRLTNVRLGSSLCENANKSPE